MNVVALTMGAEAFIPVVFVLLLLLLCRMAAEPDRPDLTTEGCRCEQVPWFCYGEYCGTRSVCEQGGNVCPWAKPQPRERAASRSRRA